MHEFLELSDGKWENQVLRILLSMMFDKFFVEWAGAKIDTTHQI